MYFILIAALFAVAQGNVVGIAKEDTCSSCQAALGKGFTKAQLNAILTATTSLACGKLPEDVKAGCTKTMIAHGSKLVDQIQSLNVVGVCQEFGACGIASQPIPNVFAVGAGTPSAACDGCQIGAEYLQDVLTDSHVWQHITALFSDHVCATAPDSYKALCTQTPTLLQTIFSTLANALTGSSLCEDLCK